MKGTIAGLASGLFLVVTLAGCGSGDSQFAGNDGGILYGFKNDAPVKGKKGNPPGKNKQTNDPGDPEPGVLHGTVVDPYIVGATFFEDENGNGLWDEGEQISTPSDEDGRFSFSAPVSTASAIIMHERGYHQGMPFTGRLLYRLAEGDPEAMVVSPLTTVTALGLSAAELSSRLTLLNGYVDYDLAADPMAGLEQINGNNYAQHEPAIANLRANLYAGVVLDLFMMNREHTGIKGDDLRALLQDWEPLSSLMEGLHYAVSGEAFLRVEEKLPAGYNLPSVTMREVAQAAPALLDWWKNNLLLKIIRGEGSQIPADTIRSKVNEVQADLVLHYYIRNNQNSEAVQQAISAGFLPAPEEDHIVLQEDGSVNPTARDIRQELLVDQMFSLGNGSRLRFINGGKANEGNTELTYQSSDGSAAKVNGTWRIEDDELLLQQGGGSDEILRLELVTDWSSHLSMRLRDGRQAVYAPESFLGRLLEESGHFMVAENK